MLVPVLADPAERPLPHDPFGLLVVALDVHAFELGLEDCLLGGDRLEVPRVLGALAFVLERPQLRLDLPSALEAGDHLDTPRWRRGRLSTLAALWPRGDLLGTIVRPEGSVMGDGVFFPICRQTSMTL